MAEVTVTIKQDPTPPGFFTLQIVDRGGDKYDHLQSTCLLTPSQMRILRSQLRLAKTGAAVNVKAKEYWRIAAATTHQVTDRALLVVGSANELVTLEIREGFYRKDGSFYQSEVHVLILSPSRVDDLLSILGR